MVHTLRRTLRRFAAISSMALLAWWGLFFLLPKGRCSGERSQRPIDLLQHFDGPEDALRLKGKKGQMMIPPSRMNSTAKLETVSESNIPMLFHQTIASREDILPLFLQWAASWFKCHPDFIHVLWDDCDIDRFIKQEAPDFWPIFQSYPVQVQRSDIFRYFVLRRFGGVYMDMDFMCTGGLINDIGISRKCHVYSVESTHPLDGGTQNSLMASTAGHPLWDTLISIVRDERKPTFLQSYYLANPMVHDSTGPALLSEAYSRYKSISPTNEGELCVLPEVHFSNRTTKSEHVNVDVITDTKELHTDSKSTSIWSFNQRWLKILRDSFKNLWVWHLCYWACFCLAVKWYARAVL